MDSGVKETFKLIRENKGSDGKLRELRQKIDQEFNVEVNHIENPDVEISEKVVNEWVEGLVEFKSLYPDMFGVMDRFLTEVILDEVMAVPAGVMDNQTTLKLFVGEENTKAGNRVVGENMATTLAHETGHLIDHTVGFPSGPDWGEEPYTSNLAEYASGVGQAEEDKAYGVQRFVKGPNNLESSRSFHRQAPEKFEAIRDVLNNLGVFSDWEEDF